MPVAVTDGLGHLGVGVDQPGDRVERFADVLVVLHDHRDRVGEHLGGQFVYPEHGECPRPVDRLRDAGRFAQIQLAQAPHDADKLLGEYLREAGVLGTHDLQLALRRRIVEEKVYAPALQGGREITGVVGRQDHVGQMLGAERADLRDGDLKLAQQLQQYRFERLVGAVDLVDQQHHRFFGAHRLKQGPWREKPLGEKDALLRADALHGLLQAAGVGDDLADLLAQDLGVQQLLAVVPFVEGLRLVLALVALQPQQPPPGRRGQCLGQLRLADTGRPLNEQRLVEPRQQENRRGEALVGDVALAAERLTHLSNGIEHAQPSRSSRSPFMQ